LEKNVFSARESSPLPQKWPLKWQLNLILLSSMSLSSFTQNSSFNCKWQKWQEWKPGKNNNGSSSLQ
jgi:hypothetical protein